jgi:hypothetical protein
MYLVRTFSLSTWISGMIHSFVKSWKPYASFTCDRCGLNIEFHHQAGDGMSSLTLLSASRLPKLSPCKHVVTLTREGNCSIYCAPDEYGKGASVRDSGSAVQVSSSPENSENV